MPGAGSGVEDRGDRLTGRDLSTGGKWLRALGALAGLIPFHLLALRFPPAFAIAFTGKSIEYEFLHEEYADEFRELNST